MASEAEIAAIKNAFVEDLTDLIFMAEGLNNPHAQQLAADGALDVYRFIQSQLWDVTREPASKPVDDIEFIDRITGHNVTVQGWVRNYDEDVAREGAEAIWARIKAKNWHIGKVAQ